LPQFYFSPTKSINHSFPFELTIPLLYLPSSRLFVIITAFFRGLHGGVRTSQGIPGGLLAWQVRKCFPFVFLLVASSFPYFRRGRMKPPSKYVESVALLGFLLSTLLVGSVAVLNFTSSITLTFYIILYYQLTQEFP
jgi:hypothetical protein